MANTINELNNSLKSGNISNLYLLYGEETYLKEFYRDSIIKEINKKSGYAETVKISANKDPGEIYELTQTPSMFGPDKIIIFNNTGWFKNEAKDSFEKYAFLTEAQENLYVIFIEESAAKNKKLYKEIEKNGVCVELNTQPDDVKEKWIAKQFNKNNINVSRDVCRYMINNCEKDFSNLHNEIEKVCLAKNAGDTATIKDIDDYCVKVASSRIFALTDNISSGNAKKALKAFNDLIDSGEPVERIFFMLSRYFKLMKQVKELAEEKNAQKAAAILKLNPYEAGQLIKSSGKFDIDTLKKAEYECLDMDVSKKNGGIDYREAAEILIIKYGTRQGM